MNKFRNASKWSKQKKHNPKKNVLWIGQKNVFKDLIFVVDFSFYYTITIRNIISITIQSLLAETSRPMICFAQYDRFWHLFFVEKGPSVERCSWKWHTIQAELGELSQYFRRITLLRKKKTCHQKLAKMLFSIPSKSRCQWSGPYEIFGGNCEDHFRKHFPLSAAVNHFEVKVEEKSGWFRHRMSTLEAWYMASWMKYLCKNWCCVVSQISFKKKHLLLFTPCFFFDSLKLETWNHWG